MAYKIFKQILFFTVITVALSQSPVWALDSAAIKGFREWKSEKIQLAMNQAVSLRNVILRTKSAGPSKNLQALERQLVQLNWNLEVSKDLSVTDYFVLYLSQQPQKDRFKMAAGKLTTAEIADLMQAYAQSLTLNPNPATETVSPTNLSSQALVAPEGAR